MLDYRRRRPLEASRLAAVMLFNSLAFLIFFPVVTALYFLLPHRARWVLLLAASCFFYMFFIPAYILILVFTIVVDYVAGIWIERSTGRRRRLVLLMSIAANVGALAVFKYWNFFAANLNQLAGVLGVDAHVWTLSLVLPIGLSFHTFQAMSYTIEVYRGAQRAERHFGIYALYVMFYPQLVAGPIERPQGLLPQLRHEHRFEYRRVTHGLKLMAYGLFMKSVIADRLAVGVNNVYADPARAGGPALLVATVFFAFQIFCDFAGYTSIALGAAEVMGIRLRPNFDRPYHARSISEFWRRWHMSLSTWFKDYLYIPLGGSRVPVPRWYANLLIVFVVSGLWHGANWTFLVWGALHGIYLVTGEATRSARAGLVARLGLDRVPRLHGAAQRLFVFALVCVGWVFFRASSLGAAWTVLSGLGTGWHGIASRAGLRAALHPLGMTAGNLVLGVAGILVIEVVHELQARGLRVGELISVRPLWQRWTLYYATVAAIVVFGVFLGDQFIYFEF